MRFESPYFLLLIFLIPVFHRVWFSRSRSPGLKLPLDVPATEKKRDPSFFIILIRYLTLIFLIVALARPQEGFKQRERIVSGIDIMMVMDVSMSMNIEDLADRSRLEVAKKTIEEFIKRRNNDRIGFGVFSGEAFTLAPPTLDYGLVLGEIDTVEVGKLKDGTAIGDGLAVAIARLKDSKAKSRVIILLTDGDNNVGQVHPETAGELAKGFGIRVYTIAIGKEGRVRLPIKSRDIFGRERTTYQWFDNALNPTLLREIADKTDGKFYRATDADALDRVFDEIDHLEKTEVKTNEHIDYRDRYSLFLSIGVFFLLMEQLFKFWLWRFAI